jgi:hypothetical protein
MPLFAQETSMKQILAPPPLLALRICLSCGGPLVAFVILVSIACIT